MVIHAAQKVGAVGAGKTDGFRSLWILFHYNNVYTRFMRRTLLLGLGIVLYPAVMLASPLTYTFTFNATSLSSAMGYTLNGPDFLPPGSTVIPLPSGYSATGSNFTLGPNDLLSFGGFTGTKWTWGFVNFDTLQNDVLTVQAVNQFGTQNITGTVDLGGVGTAPITGTLTITAVPEPTTGVLAGAMLLVLSTAAVVRRRLTFREPAGEV